MVALVFVAVLMLVFLEVAVAVPPGCFETLEHTIVPLPTHTKLSHKPYNTSLGVRPKKQGHQSSYHTMATISYVPPGMNSNTTPGGNEDNTAVAAVTVS